MLRPTPTRVHAAGSAGAPRIPTWWEANRLCARLCCRDGRLCRRDGRLCCLERPCCWDTYGSRQTMRRRRSVTVCCRSASRRRSTVACCAGKRIAVNSSGAQTLQAASARRARASLRCNLRRRCGGPERKPPALLRCARSASATQPVVMASAARGLPVSRSQRRMATGCLAVGSTAAGCAPFLAAEGCRADSRRSHCRRDIWWRIG